MGAKVLLIERARNNSASFAASLRRRYEVHIAHSGKQALPLARREHPDVIVLDAISLRTSGDRIVARLREQLGDVPIIHLRETPKSKRASVADVVLSPKFTARKIINRIERFVSPQTENILNVGPFRLNLKQRKLISPKGETTLTPKLARLMWMFLQNAGKTLDREALMRGVWKTAYMGDTRTLYVHVRWLRREIEPNPRKPQYIVTVRGVGYRFQLPDDGTRPKASKANGSPSPKNKRKPRPPSKRASRSAKKPSAGKLRKIQKS